ncbi:MAG: hypothetical protein FJ320_04260 [SAR202 cluster bacterium]|nr:hypothetical protein [SAR202 cluster bacterium]
MGEAKPTQRFARTPHLHPRLAILIRNAFLPALLLASLLSVACGDSPASTPTAGAATNAPSGTGSNSDSTSLSKEERIFVGAGRFEEVPLTLKEGDILKVEYKAEVRVSPGFGGTAAQERAIRIAVLDVDGNELANQSDKSSGSLEVTVASSGEHKVVLLNSFPLEALTVTLKYSVNMKPALYTPIRAF